MNIFKKIISNSNFKRFAILIFLLFVYIIICASSYVNAISSNIQNSIFRLHVIANSDSEEDQNLKYIVRDNVLEYINIISENATCKEEVINLAKDNITEIEKIAQQTVYENGYNYTINLSIGNFPFPTKSYGDISFPAGYYDALKIEIGEAKGQNWWCVMFPPLCFVDVTNGVVPQESKEIIENNLSQEEYKLLSENSNNINFKFKIVEMFQNISMKLAQS
ncbi:MAG: stage II sporulation protein R [Clostridia bacterium]|nr:stage II sporulation protein R [Clostridia bacterium]